MLCGHVITKTRQRLQELRAARGANVAVTFALSLIPVMGAVGAAVDYSNASSTQAALQAALDAGALAAAGANDRSESERTRIGQDYFQANFSYPNPPSATFTFLDETVTVAATYEVPTIMMGLVGQHQVKIRGEARAAKKGPPQCILLLEPKDTALLVNSHSILTAGCSIQVNSTSSGAMYVNSHSVITSPRICIKGKYKTNGTSTILPLPQINCAAMPDPLTSLPEPPEAANACQHTDVILNKGSQTLSPGVYCNRLEANAGAFITLKPGTYVIRDGEFRINAGSRVVGSEVMLFFMGEKGRLNVNGNAVVQFGPPKTGAYQDVVFFQSRDKVTLKSDPHIVNTHSESFIEGTIYAPNGQFQVNSHSNMHTKSRFTFLIARAMELNSHSTFLAGPPDGVIMTRLTK